MDVAFIRVVFVLGIALGFFAGIIAKEALIEYRILRERFLAFKKRR